MNAHVQIAKATVSARGPIRACLLGAALLVSSVVSGKGGGAERAPERTPSVKAVRTGSGGARGTSVDAFPSESAFAGLFDDLPPLPPEIRDWSMARVDAIHRYLSIERWNAVGDIGASGRTDYASVAERLLIHVDKLEAADEYVHYTRLAALAKRLGPAFKGNKEMVPDQYHPIRATAYCGTYTLYLRFVLDGCASDPELGPRAQNLATILAASLPPQIDGFKVIGATYSCKKLGTTGSIGVGFLWRRNSKIRRMKPSDGLYSMLLPKDAIHWHQAEWNDRRPLRQISIPAR